jgi:uncharacterized protein (TIGR01777 family)
MTYLITGATGFVGRSLVESLLADGHSVNYLSRKIDRSMNLRAAFHHWEDPETTLPPLTSVPRCDAVIHLAGEPVAQRWTEEVKRKIRDSRVAGTRNLVEAIGLMRHKPSVLVSSSAVGYYGDRGDDVLTEESKPGKDFLAEVCVEWEREALRATELGLRVVPIRTGVVLASGGGALQKMMPPFEFGIGGRFGNGKQWMPWIHRDDLLRLFRFAADTQSVDGPMNGTAPEPVTNSEFTRALASAIHRPALLPIPKFGLRLLLGEMADFLVESIRAVPAAAERQGFSFTYSHLQSALNAVLR